MKHLILFLLAIPHSLLAISQCDPDTRFAPSASIEFTNDWGFIAQGGISGQQSRISAHLGIRARGFVDEAEGRAAIPQAKLFPRLELGFRVVDGVHLNAGIARVPDVSATVYKRIGEKVAIYARGLYDGNPMFGLGVKVLFIKY